MQPTIALLPRYVSLVATGALIAGGALVSGATTAVAATAVTVHESDISPSALPYGGWHEDSGHPRSFGVTADGLTLNGTSVVINGYADNLPPLNNRNVSLTKSFFDAVSYTITAGQASFQIPLYFSAPGLPAGPEFVTLHPQGTHGPGTYGIDYDNDTDWVGTRPVGDIPMNEPHSLADFLAEIDDYKVRGFGFAASTIPGEFGSVSTVTWDDTTYTFVPDAVTATEDVSGSEIAPEESLSTYLGWHQGYDDAEANASVTPAGLLLTGPSQVINGYINAGAGGDPESIPGSSILTNLTSAIPNATMTMAEGTAHLQVPLWVRPPGGEWIFTSLYPATPASVGPNTFGLDQDWKSNNDLAGTIVADQAYPLSVILSAMGDDYWVVGIGVQEDAGESSTVVDLSWLGTKYVFKNPAATVVKVHENEIAPDETVYEGWHQGSPNAADQYKVTNAGLELGPLQSQVIYGVEDNNNEFSGHNYELLDVMLDGASGTVTTGTVYFQIPLWFKDRDGDPQFTTLRSVAMTAGVNQLDPYDLWATSRAIDSSGPPIGANGQRTIPQFLAAFRDYKVIGFGVLNQAGSSVVPDLTWAGQKYVFENRAPSVKAMSVKTNAGKAVNVALSITDPDGNTVTVAVVKPKNGSVSLNGATAKYTPKSGFAGSDSFTYTVTDQYGKAATAKVSVSVAAVKSSTSAKVKNGPITTNKKAKLVVTVKASGAVVKGGKVTVKKGGNTLGKGSLNGKGKVTVTLKKLKKGNQKVKVAFAGTKSAKASSKTITIKVK